MNKEKKKTIIEIIISAICIMLTIMGYLLLFPLTTYIPCDWNSCHEEPVLNIHILNIVFIILIMVFCYFIIRAMKRMKKTNK